MKIIPKQIVPFVEAAVLVSAEDGAPDAVLIDDDPLVRRVWKLAAFSAHQKLHTYPSPGAFMRVVGRYNQDIAIYIDSHLGHQERGEVFAAQLNDRGFTNISLATGSDYDEFAHFAFLRTPFSTRMRKQLGSAAFPN